MVQCQTCTKPISWRNGGYSPVRSHLGIVNGCVACDIDCQAPVQDDGGKALGHQHIPRFQVPIHVASRVSRLHGQCGGQGYTMDLCLISLKGKGFDLHA
jgi:hypothetical protein